MIAKRVARKRGRDGFDPIARYILGQKPAPRAETSAAANGEVWQRTADYILDPRLGGRVGAVRVSNCASTEVGDAIQEIQATQALNTRAKGNKTYHLVVSFPPGETPTEEQLRDIEDELCRSIGLGDHQRISAVHTDTDHLHIHIAINKVHPATRRCVDPAFDKRKLMATCERLEIKHGLTRTNHGEEQGEKMNGRGADMEAHSGLEALLGWIKTNALGDIEAVLRRKGSWQELHEVLAGYDLTIKPRAAGLVLATADGKLTVRVSRVKCALSLASLEKRWGTYTPLTGPKPAVKTQYQRAPKRQAPNSAKLWAEYQNARRKDDEARRAAFAQLKVEEERRRLSLQTWKADRRRTVRSAYHLNGFGKQEEWARYSRDAAEEDLRFDEWRHVRREEVRQQHPLPTWLAWLQAKAEAGSTEALEVLRDRLQKQETQQREAAAAFAAAADEASARAVVAANLAPRVDKAGKVTYYLRDGGKVVDSHAGAQCMVVSPHALFLALSLQAERSPNRVVRMTGEPAFVEQMIAMAAQKAMNLTFQDAGQERRRCELLGLPTVPPPAPQPSPGLLTRLGLRRK